MCHMCLGFCWESLKLQDSLLLCQTAPSNAPSKGFQSLEPAGCILWHFSGILGCEARFGCRKIQGLGIFGLQNHEKNFGLQLQECCNQKLQRSKWSFAIMKKFLVLKRTSKDFAIKNCNDLNEALQPISDLASHRLIHIFQLHPPPNSSMWTHMWQPCRNRFTFWVAKCLSQWPTSPSNCLISDHVSPTQTHQDRPEPTGKAECYDWISLMISLHIYRLVYWLF